MTPLTDQQRLFLVESTQLHEAWRATLIQAQSYRYGMKWVESKGRKYLVRATDSKGNGKSLGVRSPETEAIFEAFKEGKERSDTRLKKLTDKLHLQSRLNKAVNLGRLPNVVADILQAIDKTKARDDFRVVGTHAMHAYEAMAGIQFRMDLLATTDVDLLFDPRKKLSLVTKNLDERGLLGVLRKVDKTFDLLPNKEYRAINDDGFMVDLIIPIQDMLNHGIQLATDDFKAAEVAKIQWLANSPAVHVVSIASNGRPVRTIVPDPRAFAIHKAWLSQQADREPVKQARDMSQAKTIMRTLHEHLPNYPISPAQMRYFPKDVLDAGVVLYESENFSTEQADGGKSGDRSSFGK